jgi:hypothetical protein
LCASDRASSSPAVDAGSTVARRRHAHAARRIVEPPLQRRDDVGGTGRGVSLERPHALGADQRARIVEPAQQRARHRRLMLPRREQTGRDAAPVGELLPRHQREQPRQRRRLAFPRRDDRLRALP